MSRRPSIESSKTPVLFSSVPIFSISVSPHAFWFRSDDQRLTEETHRRMAATRLAIAPKGSTGLHPFALGALGAMPTSTPLLPRRSYTQSGESGGESDPSGSERRPFQAHPAPEPLKGPLDDEEDREGDDQERQELG